MHPRPSAPLHILITGITGFVGSHLADYLLTLDGVDVHGTVRKRSRTENIEHLRGKVRLVECDLRDMTSVLAMLRQVKPARIFHPSTALRQAQHRAQDTAWPPRASFLAPGRRRPTP